VPLVIDSGSGIFDLGRRLVREPQVQREIHVFFTHTHWDHIQGLPFFAPLFDAQWTVHIYALAARPNTLRSIFARMYSERYFPVPFDQLQARIIFHDLSFQDHVSIGATTVSCCRVNHPGYALGFRVERGDQSLFFASDAAPYEDILFGDRFHRRQKDRRPGAVREMARLQAELEQTVAGVDLLFHDANYTDQEYEKLYHFGHSSLSYAVDLGQRAGVRATVLWHHDRARHDDEVERMCQPYLDRGRQSATLVEPAQQGAVYRLGRVKGQLRRFLLTPAEMAGTE
jgi:phosphoribosyl 1,2-cyclic phosphodiesterase